MKIIAENIGKKFNKEWVFRNLSISINRYDSIAVVGQNGSGKSTLLQIISGVLTPSEGILSFYINEKQIPIESLYQQLSYTAPYLELIEELTVLEFIVFQKQFKPFSNNLSPVELIEKINLTSATNKQIRFLSSGMKQRLKLGISLYSEAPLLLLDEPTTNLDTKGIDWYREEITKQLTHRSIIICSNQRHEYEFCNREIKITDFKK